MVGIIGLISIIRVKKTDNLPPTARFSSLKV